MVSIRITVIILSLLHSSATLATEPVSGRFALTDHHGEAVSEKSFNGKYRLVFFGFTRCPVICPTTMFEVTRVMNLLGDRANLVQPLFITIDPANDTVDAIASYVEHFHSSVVGLTGSEQQIANAAKSFNATFGGTNASAGSTEIYHSSYLYLMDKDGLFLDVFGYGDKAESIIEVLGPYLSSSDLKIKIIDAWASEPSGSKASVIAGFLCVQNERSEAIRIVSASSDSVERIEIHEITHEHGIVRMKKLRGVDVAANSTVCLQPEQTHMMLIGIDEKIHSGGDVLLELLSSDGEILHTVLPQRALANTY
jgi:cytochrome oxidase Cu insertion factor (SCO1/SenC/PrrC family)/copper(I)-binding protein